MSMHDSGHGRRAGPAAELRPDFADRHDPRRAQGDQSWGAGAHNNNAQTSEVPIMVQGAGRPGQPIIGQRSIFGGGGPAFTQMPTYTPVTRAPEPRPQPQEPPQPAYSPYAEPSQPPGYQGHQPPQQPAPGYANPQPQPAQPRPQQAAPDYTSQPIQPAPGYVPADHQSQDYRAAPQTPGFPNAGHPGQQSYQPSSYNGSQTYPGQGYQPQAYPDPNATFPERIFPEVNAGDAGQSESNYAGQNFGDPSFSEQNFDANFPESSFSADSSFAHNESLNLDPGSGFGTLQTGADQGFDTFAVDSAPDFGASGETPESDPRRQLQAFDAIYDQPPQIALGSSEPTPQSGSQDFYDGERVDADFLDESQVMPPPSARSKLAMTLRGRSAFMVGSALLGAIALGGALAFAYKQSGGGVGDQPPIVQADNRPVKETPAEAGGKEFPHKNKLIYDRLTNEDTPETERLVPRQEDVAVPALPASSETAGLPTPVASTDFANPQTTQGIDAASGEAAPDGGPRRVKTMVVRPDGSVMPPPAPPATGAVAEAEGAAPPAAQAAAAPPAPTAAPEAPAAQAAPQQVAAADPKPAPAAPSKYVVQVGAHKSQTEALAIYADIQQKNPSLLGSYRPMVQKATLSNNRGTMYRLRVGPLEDKAAADKLCGELKTQGTDCFVATQ